MRSDVYNEFVGIDGQLGDKNDLRWTSSHLEDTDTGIPARRDEQRKRYEQNFIRYTSKKREFILSIFKNSLKRGNAQVTLTHKETIQDCILNAALYTPTFI